MLVLNSDFIFNRFLVYTRNKTIFVVGQTHFITFYLLNLSIFQPTHTEVERRLCSFVEMKNSSIYEIDD